MPPPMIPTTRIWTKSWIATCCSINMLLCSRSSRAACASAGSPGICPLSSDSMSCSSTAASNDGWGRMEASARLISTSGATASRPSTIHCGKY